jgi:integrase
MHARPPRTPAYRHHKPSGQAVVTLNGRDMYLGRFDSPESRAEYDRVIAEWLANGRQLPGTSDITVAELVVRYVGHVQGQYKSDEPEKIAQAVRPVRIRYGSLQARDFSPLRLKAIRQELIDKDLVRSQINKRVRRIVRMFRWAVAEELLPVAVHQALKTVEGLRKGRANVRESKAVKPVPDAWIEPVLPFLNRQVRAMVELQRLTGMRPGEVATMRTGDTNTAGRIWEYVPGSHKTDHLDRERAIQLGPRAQEVLRPWLRTNLEEHLFQPREAVAEWRSARRAARKTKVQPSQQDRSVANPEKRPGERYDAASYRRAIVTAIEKANQDRAVREEPLIPHWHPHQIRHTLGTMVRREFGLDAARAVLGHSTPVVTEIYAELDRHKAADVMERIG